MKTTQIGIIPPTIPTAKTKNINFGEKTSPLNADDEFVSKNTNTEDTEKKPKSSFSKKLAKVVILLGSGVLSYGTAKYAIHEITRLVNKYSKIKNAITFIEPKTKSKIHNVLTEATSIASGFAGVITAANISKQRKIRRSENEESD